MCVQVALCVECVLYCDWITEKDNNVELVYNLCKLLFHLFTMARNDMAGNIFERLANFELENESSGSESEDNILAEDSEDEAIDIAEQRPVGEEYVGRNGRRWTTTVEEQRGRRGRENIVRERMRPTVNPATVSEAIDLFFTGEMKELILRESNREALRAIRAGEVSRHIAERW